MHNTATQDHLFGMALRKIDLRVTDNANDSHLYLRPKPAGVAMTVEHDVVKKHICLLYDELVKHEGYAELAVDIRILKRGQKEVVIRSGRQHRYIVNQAPDAGPGQHHG